VPTPGFDFDLDYVRKLARENGIPECLLRRYPKARAELEARLPRWRETAIGELGIDLDDAEYVGGVLWYGPTHRGGQGDPEEQKRAITDRLVRWATRDSGDSSRASAAIRSVLDEYLAGR
jgi:hypothetical protein